MTVVNRWSVEREDGAHDGIAHYVLRRGDAIETVEGARGACSTRFKPIREWLTTRDLGVVKLCEPCRSELQKINAASDP